MSTPAKNPTADPLAIWGGNARLYWRQDCFGQPDRALYVGGLNVGHIMYSPTNPQRAGCPWRAWLMTDEDGKGVGWFATEREAKDALAGAAAEELCK
jgi:hypothetical protein